METSEIENLTQNIVDAVKHLEDGRLGTDTDTVEIGVWTHEVLDYGDCAESTNECIDMAIKLLNEAMDSIDSIVDSIDD
tara:strand:+ start:227 stop:463 length:237 start_codon:yes stop_codon:yes gene_type:complete